MCLRGFLKAGIQFHTFILLMLSVSSDNMYNERDVYGYESNVSMIYFALLISVWTALNYRRQEWQCEANCILEHFPLVQNETFTKVAQWLKSIHSIVVDAVASLISHFNKSGASYFSSRFNLFVHGKDFPCWYLAGIIFCVRFGFGKGSAQNSKPFTVDTSVICFRRAKVN